MNIAIVIPTHNRRDELSRAVRSVLAQSLLPNELIVVDDGSKPAVSPSDLPSIPNGIHFKLLRNSRPQGGNAARNRGIQAATTDWVAFLDDDDEYQRDKIRYLNAISESCEDAPDVIFHSSRIKVDNLDISWVSSPDFDNKSSFLKQLLVKNFIGGTSMVAVRRDELIGAGLFDEDLPALQDYEMWLRLAKRGCNFQFLDFPLTLYHHNSSTNSISKSVYKYESALSRIEQLYSSDFASLSARAESERNVRKHHVRARKYLLAGKKTLAANSSLKAFFESFKTKYLVLTLASLLGVNVTLKLRAKMNNLKLNKKISEIYIKLIKLLPDTIFAYTAFFVRHRYWPDLENPRSFSEKVTYIRQHEQSDSMRRMVADRLKVRDYVRKKAPECKLIDILWKGSKISKKEWLRLPPKFVIKANHGSGMVRVVNKADESYQEVAEAVDSWMERDYASVGREWFYEDLERYAVAERHLDAGAGVPPDFKFFCLNGRVEMVQVDIGRFSNHKRNLYGRGFRPLDVKFGYPRGEEVQKPKSFSKAVSISEKLSQDFNFIRVDLYIVEDEVYFGELTNIPENGLKKFYPKEYDFYLGSKFSV